MMHNEYKRHNEYKYDVFISYSHKDKEFVERLVAKMETEQHAGEKMRIFRDTDEIKPGHDMLEAIERGLERSRYVCPIISPNSIKAEWPRMEWSIAVSSDPSGRKGKVIPLWLGGCEIPPALRIRRVLYFVSDEQWSASYQKLIAILKESPALPNADSPRPTVHPESFPITYEDDVDEQIRSNLFPVSQMPKVVWYGPTTYSNKDVYRQLETTVSGTLPTFTIKSKQIFCFWDLEDPKCPFKSMLSANVIEKDSVDDWIKDPSKNPWLMELLNKGIKHHCGGLHLWFDNAHKRYTFRPADGDDRRITWHTGNRKSRRTVVKKHTRNNGDVFWAHQSLKAKFITLGKDIFLQLNSGWTFTSDGKAPLPQEQTGPLSVKWTTNEHNASMLYHIRFWSRYLSGHAESIALRLGGSTCKINMVPRAGEMNKGLEDDALSGNKMFEVAGEEIGSAETLRSELIEADEIQETWREVER